MHASLGERNGFNDAQAEDVISYLTHVFGPNSVLPKSPADLPYYKDTVIPFSDEALKIVYVDYDMIGPTRFPGRRIPTRTEISSRRNTASRTSSTGSIRRPAR